MDQDWVTFWEGLSYIVTVLGLPAAIFLYLKDSERQRLTEHQEIDGKLKEEYNDILDNLIEHPELDKHDGSLSGDQAKQQEHIYQKLIGCFETSFIRLYGRKEVELQRMWYSWQDVIDEWLHEQNFSNMLASLLVGEDEKFSKFIRGRVMVLAESERVDT